VAKDARVTPLGESAEGNQQSGQTTFDLQAIEDLEKQHSESEALKQVAAFLKNHPGDAKGWSLKARILAGLNLAAEAAEAQKTAIEFDLDKATGWADMIYCLSLLAGETPKSSGIKSEIRSAAEHAISLGDDHEMAWDLLVWACGATGDSAGAKKYGAIGYQKCSRSGR
jgi:predicted Zn-dependent protease